MVGILVYWPFSLRFIDIKITKSIGREKVALMDTNYHHNYEPLVKRTKKRIKRRLRIVFGLDSAKAA